MKQFKDYDVDACDAVADILQKGGVALVPTETVYGLIACSNQKQACARIFEIKARDTAKRLQFFFKDIESIIAYGADLTPEVEKIIRRYCPGAFMPIVPMKNGETLGFRIPDHPFVQALLHKIDVPLVATSANRSGMPNIRHVHEALGTFPVLPDAVVDAGEIPETATASTIVDFTQYPYKIVRQGALLVDLESNAD